MAKRKDIGRLVTVLAASYEVIGPIQRGKEVVLGHIAQVHDLSYYVGSPMSSPKSFLHPPRERIFSFKRSDGSLREEPLSTRRQALFAIHPCDVHAILIQDRVMSGRLHPEEDPLTTSNGCSATANGVKTGGGQAASFPAGYTDPRYWARRERTLMVALNCTEVGENCFCASLGTGPGLKAGYDLLLTHLGGHYLVEVGSEAGARIAARLELAPARAEDLEDKARRLKDAQEQMKKAIDIRNLPEELNRGSGHPYWQELSEACLGCGNCAMVCPTCYCYNVTDRLNLKLDEVERIRTWDACLLKDYAAVHGANFRQPREARLRQFVHHKLSYWREQYGTYGCVGCGRCIAWCPAGIDITKVAQTVRGGEKE
ncbi:MAG: 4Fe-4S dicluster domain-containing protein [Candidatus Tectomicrobia bacterium]|uniref:4Fe-4S dicluster domain-containing protein n=1 Tax=Tectimicrobiota bacterium TaxID=2528274 RepID=A0A932CNE2_UNCTE|nr:4Fe-4S dicluster domain-containing protein [Candidatus Tectomicrobia bacterium]